MVTAVAKSLMHFTIAYKSELHTNIDEPKTQKCPSNDIHICV